jgi:bacteriocin-like protein
MKLDITRDLQSSTVLELSDTELAAVSGGFDRDRGDHDDRRWFHRRDYSDWQNSDCFGGYNSQQVFFVEQQSAPCVVIPSSCY